MNGVAVIDRVTIDCIFSGMAGFPERGGALYGSVLHDPGRGCLCDPGAAGEYGRPGAVRHLLGQGLLSKTAETLLQKYKVQNLHNFMTATGSR